MEIVVVVLVVVAVDGQDGYLLFVFRFDFCEIGWHSGCVKVFGPFSDLGREVFCPSASCCCWWERSQILPLPTKL